MSWGDAPACHFPDGGRCSVKSEEHVRGSWPLQPGFGSKAPELIRVLMCCSSFLAASVLLLVLPSLAHNHLHSGKVMAWR
jgi:hypothetical protein